MPAAATAVTKASANQVATLVTLLVNVNAALAALAGASPTLMMWVGPTTVPPPLPVAYTPSAAAIAAIIADLQAQVVSLTAQLAGFGVTN